MISYYKELGRKMSDDDRIYLLIKILPLNYKMKLSNYLALTDPKSQNYLEIKASLINMFERENAWNLIPQNTLKRENMLCTVITEQEVKEEPRKRKRKHQQ